MILYDGPAVGKSSRERRRGEGKRPAPAGARKAVPVKTLDRVLSRAGIGSRTQAAEWIAAGRVRVNGRIVRSAETWVDPVRDQIGFDGQRVGPGAAERTYLLFYKPEGCLTTRTDPAGRRTVFDLLPRDLPYLFPVGRLDLNTSGLLLLTNNSAFAERITNPDFKIPKTYLVKSATALSSEQLDSVARGVVLKDGPTRPARVARLREVDGETEFEITLTEGRNRQVRRMVEAVGSTVLTLARIAIGPLRIGDLPIGRFRPLDPAEVQALCGPLPGERDAGEGA